MAIRQTYHIVVPGGANQEIKVSREENEGKIPVVRVQASGQVMEFTYDETVEMLECLATVGDDVKREINKKKDEMMAATRSRTSAFPDDK